MPKGILADVVNKLTGPTMMVGPVGSLFPSPPFVRISILRFSLLSVKLLTGHSRFVFIRGGITPDGTRV